MQCRQRIKQLQQKDSTKASEKPTRDDWSTRCSEFYARHRKLVVERLDGFGFDLSAVLAQIDTRRAVLASASPTEIETCIASYTADLHRTAAELLAAPAPTIEADK